MRDDLLSNRIANLLGVLGVAVTDAVDSADSKRVGRSPSETAALITVFNYPNQSISSLAAALNLSHSASVRVTGELMAEELVKGSRGADRRNVTLAATAKGRRLAAAILAERRERMRAMLATLTPAERKDLVGLIEKLLTGATRTEQDADRLCRFCDLKNCPQDVCPVETKACALRVGEKQTTASGRG
jgi:DNA-binding MarR family transcriptional regulator